MGILLKDLLSEEEVEMMEGFNKKEINEMKTIKFNTDTDLLSKIYKKLESIGKLKQGDYKKGDFYYYLEVDDKKYDDAVKLIGKNNIGE